MTSRRRAALLVGAVALTARLLVVAWAAQAFPPTADGSFYHVVAERIATGQGYTWLWTDGAVTYAAHYPVGYPALVGLMYAIFGAKPVFAMLLNAAFGAAAAVAAYDLLARATRPALAMLGGLAVALHPALVPYTVALMTEGMTAALLTMAAAACVRARDRDERRWRWIAATGLAMGLATLVRPQSIALAPVLGWLAFGTADARRRVLGAAVATALAVGVCAPWTVRNCVRMDRCALVSVNGGWNLAIGTQTTDGAWRELVVPDTCKEVFAEAAKDTCFGRAATQAILADPAGWVARAPAKLRATFDYFGAAPWYLHTANPARFPYRAKVALGVVETAVCRLLLAAALVSAARWPGPRRRVRLGVVGVGLIACAFAPGALAYVALGVAIALLGRRALEDAPAIVPITAAVVLSTAATHAVFFGAGRYGLVVVPFVTALAFMRRGTDAAPGPAHRLEREMFETAPVDR